MMWLMIQKGEWMLNWRSSYASAVDWRKSVWLKSITAALSLVIFPRITGFPASTFQNLQTSMFPSLAFCLGFMGSFCLITRRLLLLVSAFAVLFLISVGDSCALQPFLYAHVFYFKLFRNLHFLLWLSFPIAVLACGELLRLSMNWISREPCGPKRLLLSRHTPVLFFSCGSLRSM